MRRLLPALLLLAAVRPAWGHPMPSSTVVLRIHRSQIEAELTLPIVELTIGWEKPLPLDAAQTVRKYGEELKDYVREHVRATAPDGRPWTVTVRELVPVVEQSPDVRVMLSMTPPLGAPLDRLTFHYDLIFHHLITHTAVVSLATDWRNGVTGEESVLLGTMRDTSDELVIDRSGGSWSRGFAAMFRLGGRHIAEGTDHLLFLLALILPAPLVASGWRWGGYAGWRTAFRRIIKVVTAFTLGHSITLVFGALGWVRLPSVLVESAIAFSILVSAIHALVPVFRGREILIAGGFGLVHGLAFASTLAGFGFDPWTMVSSVLGFNLGIEAVQLVVILAAMPWLVLLARSRIYGPFRITGAALTGIAATAWLAERAFGRANPIVPLVESAASHSLWLLAGLVILAVSTSLLFAQDEAGARERKRADPVTAKLRTGRTLVSFMVMSSHGLIEPSTSPPRSTTLPGRFLSKPLERTRRDSIMTWLYAALALLSGAALAVQVGFNNGLRERMGHPVPAAFTSFATGTLALFALCLALRPAWPRPSELARGPWWIWLGGVVGVCYIMATVAFANKLGAAGWLGVVVTGQILTSVLLDHYGLVGFTAHPVGLWRFIGVGLLLAGAAIVLRT